MKNVWILILFGLLGAKGFGQGVDVVFFIDNSDSMHSKDSSTSPNREYEDAYTTVQSLMESVLACNSDNRVAVVQFSYRHYGATGSDRRPRIYIEGSGAFVNTPFTFPRRWNNDGGYPYSCIETLHNVLAGIPNPTSPQRVYGSQTLSRTPGNKLIICMVTDAGTIGEDLILMNASGNAAFANYTDLKNYDNTKIVMIQGPGTDIIYHQGLTQGVKDIAAGISSRVGSYFAPVYNYSDDPDGQGMPYRKITFLGNDPDIPTYWDGNTYYNDANFLLTQAQLDEVTEHICMESPFYCHSSISLYSSSYDVTNNQTQVRQAEVEINATNKINNGAVAIYHAGEDVVLLPGFNASAGSHFRGYIEGCSGEFEARIGNFSQSEETDESQIETLEDISFFHIAPNPASTAITITGTEAIQSILITSLDGKTLYSQTLHDKTNSFEVVIDGYSNGMYNITVTTADGKTQTQKLVKN